MRCYSAQFPLISSLSMSLSLSLMPSNYLLLLFAIIDYSHGELAIFIYIMLHIINMDAIFDLSLFAIISIFLCV